jgi:hypothetical protein
MRSTTLKTAVPAPMPSAMANTAATVNVGDRTKPRAA